MTKKIVKAKATLDFSHIAVPTGSLQRTYANAKEAIASIADELCLETFGFDSLNNWDLPDSFKLVARVRFMRNDGKIVTRKVFKTVKAWSYGWTEEVAYGSGSYQYDEVYHAPYVTFA